MLPHLSQTDVVVGAVAETRSGKAARLSLEGVVQVAALVVAAEVMGVAATPSAGAPSSLVAMGEVAAAPMVAAEWALPVL
jgi:hypothetical protein